MISIPSLILAALAVPVQAAVVTEIDYVTQYAYENYDVIVDPQGNPITTSIEIVSTSPGGAATQTSVSTEAAPATPAQSHTHSNPENYNYISVTSSEPAPATSSSAPPPPPPAPTTTSSSSTPPPPPPPAPTTTSSSSTPPPPPPPAPTTTSSSSTPPPPPPPQTPTTSPSSSAPAPAPSSTSSSGGGQFSGDATFYDVGLGACGTTNSDSDLIAALNYEQWDAFGSMSNGNPACGKKATISYQGKSVTVTVEDKCPGCKYGDLDLSPAAFKQLADEGAGRIHVTWSFD